MKGKATLNNTWIIDTGASDHMTNDPSLVKNLRRSSQNIVSTADGTPTPVTGEGSIVVSDTLTLESVLVVPSLAYNLLSVGQIILALACIVTFYPSFCVFQDILTRRILGYGVRRGKLYYLDLTETGENHKHLLGQANQINGVENAKEAVWLWHRRLGHLSFSYLKKLQPHLFSVVSDLDFHCDICELAKSHRISYSPSLHKSPVPFMKIHSDVWGPAKIPSLSGARYFVTFIDDCTRMTWVSFLKNKSDVFGMFIEFHKMVATQYLQSIRVFQSDNGGEFVNGPMIEFCRSHGIRHQTSNSYTPQQNGLAERKNRQLMEVVRASLFGMNVPRSYWGEAVKSAAYLINRTPSRVIEFQNPHQKLHTFLTIPSMPNLEPRVFGCTAYVHIPKPQRNKLDPRARKCIFVGYADFQKGYRCYDPLTGTLHVSLDVAFRESEPYYSGGASQSSLQGERGCEGNPRSIIDFDVFKDLENLEDTFEGRKNLETENAVAEQSIVNSEIDNATAERSVANSETENATAEQSVVNSETENVTAEQSVVNSETEETTFLDSLNQNQDVSEAHTQDIPPSTSPTEDPGQNDPPQVPLNFNESSGLESVEPRKSQRVAKGIPKKQYEPDIKAKAKYPIANFMSNHRISGSHALVIDQLSTVSIPSNVQDALTNPKWTKAMNEELEALQKNATWELVPMPVGKKTVGCRWVFTVKLNADGTINRYKARLVAKGYTQRYGIDYEETFAPVAKINTVRILISLAANKDWPLHQFDVKNAFLNGNLEEEVYMDVPPGVKNYPSEVGKVCKLKKSLYGLKQSPRAWFGRFSKSMRAFGYRQSNSDHTLFIKRKNGKITALIVYVDDMIVTGDDPKEMNELQKYLSKEFEMKDLGQLKYFLGIEVARSKKGISLSQRKYVLDLLTETGMLDCSPIETPIEMNHRLAIYPDQIPTDKGRYQRLVGRLIYLSHTRPDIAYANIWMQFFRILRYLKMAPGKGLLFEKKDELEVGGYTYADWAGDKTDRRSTSGYFTFVGGNLVTWRSKKQKVVARSSAEAEFRGMAHGVCEMLWIRNVLKDLGYKLRQPMDLHCDNKAAIEIAHNPVQHDRTKHVEVDRHFIKENLDRKVIRFPFVNSKEQLADVLTKGVCRKIFDSSVDKLGMIDIYAPT
ncbi:putative RNA-directed DNA polymerase [Rosa chinensis]|uniref:Putative RNA-directed DNA polymerase n=1 Tax=Rosa chinensis TaxID=74649 RepID=A0A2P6QTV3_ROSCH|nr:putative RNA-directed DNA polymerase [Rosa chinensis]